MILSDNFIMSRTQARKFYQLKSFRAEETSVFLSTHAGPKEVPTVHHCSLT